MDEVHLEEFLAAFQGNSSKELLERIRLQLRDENSDVNRWLDQLGAIAQDPFAVDWHKLVFEQPLTDDDYVQTAPKLDRPEKKTITGDYAKLWLSIAALILIGISIGIVVLISNFSHVQIADGASNLYIGKDGDVSGLEVLPNEYRDQVASLLTTGDFETPQAFDEISAAIGEMSTGGGPDDKMLAPVGTVVASMRPIFRWASPSGVLVERYVVEVFDSNRRLVAVSVDEDISMDALTWSPNVSLTAGECYTWRVAAITNDGATLMLPSVGQGSAKFKVISELEFLEMNRQLQEVRDSRLASLNVYIRFGLLDLAQKELDRLSIANPNVTAIQELEKSFLNLRRRAP